MRAYHLSRPRRSRGTGCRQRFTATRTDGPICSAGEIHATKAPRFFARSICKSDFAILSRRVGAGTKLPSTRALAAELVVARTSVVAAYEQLLAEGYVSGRNSSGTSISAPSYPTQSEPLPVGPKTCCSEKQSISPRAHGNLPPSHPRRHHGANLPFDAGARAGRCPDNTALEQTEQARADLDRPRSPRIFRPARFDRASNRNLRPFAYDASRPMRADQVIVTSGAQQATDITIRGLAEPRRRRLGRRSRLPPHLSGAGCFRRQNSSDSG